MKEKLETDFPRYVILSYIGTMKRERDIERLQVLMQLILLCEE